MKIKVNGMMCNGCANRVKTALIKIGCSNIEVDLEQGFVTFDSDINVNNIQESIELLGFEFVGEVK